MIDVDDFITLVIHTPERAQSLKNILESHGIETHLEDFVSHKANVAVAQRVKIRPKDLPLCLKIIESGEGYSPALIEMKMNGESGNLLIPVDFSSVSRLAVTIGFKLARRMGVHPVVMHSYVAAMYTAQYPSEVFPDDIDNNEGIDIRVEQDIRKISASRLAKFKKEIRQWQKDGSVPVIAFSTILLEGVPEEAILQYCKDTPPALVVMATRGKERKEEELVGSVTAEVLDSCRVPVFTVPDNCNLDSIESITRLMLFCTLTQHDIITVDSLMRMFDYPRCSMTLVNVSAGGSGSEHDKMDALCSFFNTNYPTARFNVYQCEGKDFRADVDKAIHNLGIQLLIIPNKKTNIFSRIFRPTIAHRFLFERDMPMLAIPV